MLTKKSDIDMLEKSINQIGVGLTDSEVAQCLNKTFVVAPPIQIGRTKTAAVYLTAMKILHARIVQVDGSVGDFGNWLWRNGYWPLPVVGAKG